MNDVNDFWIPMSSGERPKFGTPVLATVKLKGRHAWVDEFEYMSPGVFINRLEGVPYTDDELLAWMVKPAPYKKK